MSDEIKVTDKDLYSDEVEEVMAEQQVLQAGMPSVEPPPLWRRIVLNSIFFLALAGALGGMLGWLLLEPFFNESVELRGTIETIDLPPGESEGQMLTVGGKGILVAESVTEVEGRDEYAGIDQVDELAEGQPVQVHAMIIDAEQKVFLGRNVIVREPSPGAVKPPEPDLERSALTQLLAGIGGFALVGMCIAGAVGAADGLMSRNLRRGLVAGLCGMGIAIVGGLVGLLPGGMLFGLALTLVNSIVEHPWTSDTLGGLPLMILAVGRSLTWGVLGATVGLGPGAGMRSKKLLLNGLLGGVLGGLLGGLFFDPISRLSATIIPGGEALLSRGVGFSLIGLSAGLMIGLVQQMAKDAWLLMQSGPLKGKQFIIYKDPTVIGSSPKSDIYIFKDPEVEPRHATISKSANRYEIEDQNSPAGTFVNGQRVERQALSDGDQIAIGETVLQFSEKSAR